MTPRPTRLIPAALLILLFLAGTAAGRPTATEFLDRFTRAVHQGDFQAAEELVRAHPRAAGDARFMHIPDGDVLRHLSRMLTRYLNSRSQTDPALTPIQEMNRLYREGQEAMLAARYTTAIEKWKQGLAIAGAAENERARAAFMGNLGTVHDTLGRYGDALTYYLSALSIDRKTDDLWGLANDLSNVGVIQMHMGQYSEALKNLEEALTLHRDLGHRRGRAANLSNIGLIYQNLGQYEKALSCYNRALALKRETGDRRGEGLVLSNMGVVHHNLGQYETALDYYQEALSIHQDLGDRRGVGKDLSNIGLMHNNLGNYRKALEHYEKALTIRRLIGDRRGEGADLANIGLAHHNLGNDNQALTHYNKALVIHREIGDRRGEGRVLSNMGMLFDTMGEHRQAAEFLSHSLETIQEIGTPESVWRAHRRLGQVKATLYEIQSAIDHYEAALSVIETIREELSVKSARSAYMQSKIYIYDELIELLADRHRLDPGAGYGRKALEVFERKQGRLFLEEMGQSGARYFSGVPEEILRKEKELIRQRAAVRKTLTRERSRPLESLNAARVRQLEGELADIQRRQDRLETTIREEYPDYYAMKYPQPVDLETLQSAVLRPGEILLVYDIRTNGASAWVVGRNHFSMHPIRTRAYQMADKVQQYRDYGLQLKTRNLRGIKIRLEVTEPPEAPELYPILFPEPVRQALATAAHDDSVRVGGGCAHRPATGGNGGSLLYVVPTGALYELPFESLVTRKADTGGEDGERPRYLIEDHAVAYLSSASLLKILREARTRRRERPRHPLLAFANPEYRQSGGETSPARAAYRAVADSFPPLPETEEEVKAIKETLRAPDASDPLQLRSKAARSRVFQLNDADTLNDYRYLVFATHGILPGEIDQVTQPALILSDPDPRTGEAGFLTMADVFGLDFNADLIALTACNTGRGADVRGEGVMGLTRSFMYAGTPAIAVTLWSVESESIKDLNVGMFKNLTADMGRARALREVKLRMIGGKEKEAWRHPFYWAPMVLFGDGR